MAKLPNVDRAIVPGAKLTAYLLSHDHPRGRAKARFLESFGFSRGDCPGLHDALVAHAAAHEVSRQHPSQTGTRYEIGGPLPSPDGRAPVVRVVRFIDTGEDVPRLVTLVPSRMTRR